MLLKEVKVKVEYPFLQIGPDYFYTYVPEEISDNPDYYIIRDVAEFLMENISFSWEFTGEDEKEDED